MTRSRRDAVAFLSGVFLLCMSVLMIQIVQTRILSVVSLYYMAFFSISMAMLGLTGGALIVYYKLDHVNPRNVNAFLSRTSTAFALSVAACFALKLASPLPSLAWATYIVVKFNRLDPLSNIYHIKWNSFSRIAASIPMMSAPFLWGASPTAPGNVTLEQRELTIDGMAGTWMPQYSDAPGRLDFLRYDVTNLAYYARHSGRSAVIGVGSGRDMLSAHLFGFRDITGVELNPIFINLLTDPAKLRAYAGIADLPGMRFVVDDGRSWFARTQEKFDLIEMSMVDTWAATGAGAFSLSENGLYTVEGWKTFLSALS